jgi:hypothetical protein
LGPIVIDKISLTQKQAQVDNCIAKNMQLRYPLDKFYIVGQSPCRRHGNQSLAASQGTFDGFDRAESQVSLPRPQLTRGNQQCGVHPDETTFYYASSGLLIATWWVFST